MVVWQGQSFLIYVIRLLSFLFLELPVLFLFCNTYINPYYIGSVAEWSKAQVLGTSLFEGIGSNPTTANIFVNFSKII
jgi:hypothetical protein